MDALVPMASQPAPMASRNWMLRRLMVETIRNDPEWYNGDYTTQPSSARLASVFFGVATSGGTLAYQHLAPTREQADKLVDERIAAPFTADANDFIYQWSSSVDYDPSPNLERIAAAVLAINSADDERNPPETGITERHAAAEERAALPGPQERGDARPRHDRFRQVLHAAASGIPAKRAAAGDVSFKPSVAGQRTCQGLSLPMPVNLRSLTKYEPSLP